MTMRRPADDHVERLTSFVRDRLIGDEPELRARFDERSPLFESGILDSLRTAMLLNFIRREIGVAIPTARWIPENFRTVGHVAAMIRDVTEQPEPAAGDRR